MDSKKTELMDKKVDKKNKNETVFICVAGCLLLAALLWPYVKNGMWFDDALNSQTWGMVNRFHTSVWDFSMRVATVWLTQNGRVLFCWPWIYGFFYCLRDVWMVRIADMTLVVAHIGLVMYLLRRLRVEWATVGFFVLFLFSMFQIRYADDPIAAYASFCQVLGIALTAALILLVKWRETGVTGYLAASTVLVTASMLCYELNAVFIPIAIGAILTSKHARRLRALAIVLVPFFLFVGLNLYVKHNAPSPYPGSALGSAALIPGTYLKQLVATFPGSFYALQGNQTFPLKALVRAAKHNHMAWGIAFFSLTIFLLLARFQKSGRYAANRGLIMTAAMLLVISGSAYLG